MSLREPKSTASHSPYKDLSSSPSFLFPRSSMFFLSAYNGACLPHPLRFLLTPSLIFPQIWDFLKSLQGSAFSVLVKKAAGKPKDLVGTAVLSLAAGGRDERCLCFCTLLCPFYALWSSCLTSSKGQHRRYISTSKSCGHSTTFSYQLSTTLGGFQNHVARKQLSQLIPRLWSDLFVNQARKSYP